MIPFGLTNAPATFQGLINTVKKFVLVFVDDILTYNKTLDDHIIGTNGVAIDLEKVKAVQ